MLILIKLATWMLSPLGIVSSLLIIGLVIKKLRLPAFVLGAALLWLFSSYWVSQDLLLRGLEDQTRMLQARSQASERQSNPVAIVVLGGGLIAAAPPERIHPDLLPAADRVWHAARLYHEKRASLIVLTGGQRVGLEGSGLQSEAEAMRIFLRDLGVPDAAMLIEDQARTTRENASKTFDLLNRKIQSSNHSRQSPPEILLVTSASHMPRAIKNYMKAGFHVIPAPAEFNAVGATLATWEKILPSESNLATSSSAIKEWIALMIGY
ncbi:MAG: hypothetical protein RLZZ290_995 [Pseudomonadota bacterium]|jgi:uncharacterized SAM-binding protein YcdF (DUF218 family)